MFAFPRKATMKVRYSTVQQAATDLFEIDIIRRALEKRGVSSSIGHLALDTIAVADKLRDSCYA